MKGLSIFWTVLLMVFHLNFLPVLSSCAMARELVDDEYRIGFHFWKSGAIYDEAYQGIIDGLDLAGIRYQPLVCNSHRDEAAARQNLVRMEAEDLDLIISLSSAGTRLAADMHLKTPLIATVINHPVSLGIQGVGDNGTLPLSGTSYYVDTDRQLQLYQELLPSLSRVGMIFDHNNPAGYLAEAPLMEKSCTSKGLAFISRGIAEKKDLAGAATALVDAGVDLIVIPTNFQVYGHLDEILKIATPRNIPVVSMNKQGVESGALAALFADTYKLGRLMVSIAGQILVEKKKIGEIPFLYIPRPDLIINLEAARRLNYEFGAAVLGRASIVLD